MSSTAYFAEIRPDPMLRRIVLASGAVLALAGIPLILILPVAPALRALSVSVWLVMMAIELSRARRAWYACHALRFFADGTVVVLNPERIWQPATLISGSVLLRNLGWIRLSVALPSGKRLVLGECLRGDGSESADWRRLQVIWRHVGA